MHDFTSDDTPGCFLIEEDLEPTFGMYLTEYKLSPQLGSNLLRIDSSSRAISSGYRGRSFSPPQMAESHPAFKRNNNINFLNFSQREDSIPKKRLMLSSPKSMQTKRSRGSSFNQNGKIHSVSTKENSVDSIRSISRSRSRRKEFKILAP